MKILICSEKQDYTTSYVIQWLLYFNKKVVRVNSDDFLYFTHHIGENGGRLSINGTAIEEFTRVWYRKGHFCISHIVDSKRMDEDLAISIQKHSEFEVREYLDAMYPIIEELDDNLLTARAATFINKISVLNTAVSVGLNIPPTLISNTRAEIVEFVSIHGYVTSKSLRNNFVHVDPKNGYKYVQYNKKFSISDLGCLGDSPLPSIVQKYIDKKYELRVFFIEKKLFPMCIFSQSNELTKTDFRQYDIKKANRCVPYQLPSELSEKILKFIKKINLNTGSMDFICDLDGNYHFLEVNPIGQLGMVSEPCNYLLEREIAKYLAL